MNEAKFQMNQRVQVEVGGDTSCSIEITVKYDNPKQAEGFIRRAKLFMVYASEYPNAQLDLLKGAIKTLPAGDSRTDAKK